jgi:uncharacterized membrane protein YsdA (DUF1294 family)
MVARMLWQIILAINVVTFLVFGFDKWRARREKRRIPEAWLLTLSAATGCIGGWIAMSTFRHKTKKRSFQLKMIGVTLLNGLWVWLYLRFSGTTG